MNECVDISHEIREAEQILDESGHERNKFQALCMAVTSCDLGWGWIFRIALQKGFLTEEEGRAIEKENDQVKIDWEFALTPY
jgi:hypothetical protein|tara:strand:+ start:1984 stop:2229 length:246 start_codon:yes stop_codon:yes gene_type:complete